MVEKSELIPKLFTPSDPTSEGTSWCLPPRSNPLNLYSSNASSMNSRHSTSPASAGSEPSMQQPGFFSRIMFRSWQCPLSLAAWMMVCSTGDSTTPERFCSHPTLVNLVCAVSLDQFKSGIGGVPFRLMKCGWQGGEHDR